MNSQLSTVKGSLQQTSRDQGITLAESFVDCDVIVLVDVSGSMEINDAPGGQKRYDAAVECLERLQLNTPGKIGVIAFSDTVKFCPGGVPLFEGNGTKVAEALTFVKVVDGCDIKIILISDGEPDHGNDIKALKIAQTFESKIDTIYIGSELDSSGGRAFLAELAEATGGTSVTSDEPGMLESPMLLLMGKSE